MSHLGTRNQGTLLRVAANQSFPRRVWLRGITVDRVGRSGCRVPARCLYINAGSDDVWSACSDFMMHLYWHKPRLIMDDRLSKPEYLWNLSWLFGSVGNLVERKRLIHSLKLGREQKDDNWVAKILGDLSGANRQTGPHGAGIPQAKETSEIFEQLDDMAEQAGALLCCCTMAANSTPQRNTYRALSTSSRTSGLPRYMAPGAIRKRPSATPRYMLGEAKSEVLRALRAWTYEECEQINRMLSIEDNAGTPGEPDKELFVF